MFPPGAAGRLGVLMLATRFPRPRGDVGHPSTWRADTEFRVVDGMGPLDAVRDAAGLLAGPVLPAFAAAAITTSCGFLVLLQNELQAAVGVPVATSSLLLLPRLLARQRQVGVLTISAEHLGHGHLLGAGVPASRLGDVIMEGVDGQSEFARAILGNREAMDIARAGRDVVAAALALRRRAPHLATLVLECTNMPPYAPALREATGWEVLGLSDVPALMPYAA